MVGYFGLILLGAAVGIGIFSMVMLYISPKDDSVETDENMMGT